MHTTPPLSQPAGLPLALTVGTRLAELELPPISRATLALFAGASGDHNPMHIDTDFAQAAGAPEVFAHGMLAMAYLGRYLTALVPPSSVQTITARFLSITPVGARLRVSAVVTAIGESDAPRQVALTLSAKDETGTAKLEGSALLLV